MTWRPRTKLSAGAVVWAVFIATVVVCTLGLVAARALGAVPATPEQLRAQLVRERHQHAVEVRVLRRRLHAAVTTPDAVIAARLAGIAYGQDAGQLLACADSEGWDWRGRHERHNTVPNAAGSGAVGALQFMPATFAGTPQGRAGLPISRVDVQLAAAAWMWQQGRRGEWTGAGC